jgi:tyrosine-protein phosphatase YwqE
VDGRLGAAPRACAARLFDLGLVNVLASDAHGPDVRASGLSAAVDALGDRALGEYLTLDAPGAILAGQPVPPPPA